MPDDLVEMQVADHYYGGLIDLFMRQTHRHSITVEVSAADEDHIKSTVQKLKRYGYKVRRINTEPQKFIRISRKNG